MLWCSKLVNHKLDVNKTTLNVLYDERLDLGLIQRVKARAKYTDYYHDEFDQIFWKQNIKGIAQMLGSNYLPKPQEG